MLLRPFKNVEICNACVNTHKKSLIVKTKIKCTLFFGYDVHSLHVSIN